MAERSPADPLDRSPDGSCGASPSRFDDPPKRSHPAHGVRIFPLRPTIIYLTVCTKARRPYLATARVHDLLREVWTGADAWLVGRYVVMPDHLHLFAAPGKKDIPFDNWVRYWKSHFTWRFAVPAHAWQTDHWDRRLRNEDNYEEKWEYVRGNPVRHGLVHHAEEWPHQGELNRLVW